MLFQNEIYLQREMRDKQTKKQNKMKVFIKENTWLTRGIIDFGWGNGYVLIPKNSHLHGKHYDDIDVDVHGGLTFSELVDAEMVERWGLDKEDEGKWCVGFDTAHYADNLSKWPKEKVQEEAERLKEQLLSYEAELKLKICE